jgi:hypothetical protein
MSTTIEVLDSLNLHEMGENPTAPAQSHDVNLARLAEALAGYTTLDLSTGGAANFSATPDQIRGAIVVLSGTTAARSVIVENLPWRRLFFNPGAFDITIKCAATAGVVVPAGWSRELYCIGTQVKAVFGDLAGYFAVDVSSGGTSALDSDIARATNLEFTGALPSNTIRTVPAVPHLFFVKNSTTGAYSFTLKTAGGTGVEVPAGETRLLICDGVNVAEFAGGSGGALPPGGDTGEVLAKLSATDGDAGWVDVGAISLPDWLGDDIHVDAPQATPHGIDDHFTAALENWVWENQGDVTDTIYRSHLQLRLSGTDNNTVHVLRRNITLPTGDYVLEWAQGIPAASTQFNSSGIFFKNSANGKYSYVTPVWVGSSYSVAFGNLNADLTYNSDFASIYVPVVWYGKRYYRIVKTGSIWSFYISTRGITYELMASANLSTYLGAAPDYIGFGLWRNGATQNANWTAEFDFIRVKEL